MPVELLVSRGGDRFWAATREDGAVVEIRSERAGDRLAAGQVYKARVSKVLPGIQSAFLDVGSGRDAFLHASDLPPEGPGAVASPEASFLEDAGDEEESSGLAASPGRRANLSGAPPIEDRLRAGSELLVQVDREAIGAKGARVTGWITLPGRFLVYLPLWAWRGISRRIVEPAERERLRAIVDAVPAGTGGFIVRTAGSGVAEKAIRADAGRLERTWSAILARADAVRAPALVHEGDDLPLRLLRDAPPGAVERVVLDDPAGYERALGFLREVDPELMGKVRLHPIEGRLFEDLGIDQEVERALRPKVWLKSGGSIVIEPTEALVSIDVNTGKFVGTKHPEETVLRTNLEAAREIARQLRLRDLGGIIVIDFIDMDRPESRRRVLEALEEALRRDRARTKIVGLSELGLVQLTRKRTRPGIRDALTRGCPTCAGSGRIKSAEIVAAEVLAEVRRLHPALAAGEVRVRVHPDVEAALRVALQAARPHDGAPPLRVVVEADPGVRPDGFDVQAS